MRDWPHSPAHQLSQAGAYIVTSGTYLKEPVYRGAQRLEYLCDLLLGLAEKYKWDLQAWAVFPNHYHFVAFTPRNPESLRTLIKHLHSVATIQANKWDGKPGRKVWFQYWETVLTFPASYFARLSYVHRNAVHHGIVREPSLYPWCSAGWFQRRATTALYRRIMAMQIDRVSIEDGFDVKAEEI